MDLFSYPCPGCTSHDGHPHTRYTPQTHGMRTIYHCRSCDIYYSETFATPIAGLTTPLSQIIEILKARSEGMSLNATARTFSVSKKSVIAWDRRLAKLNPTLRLYSILHDFIHQEIEGSVLHSSMAWIGLKYSLVYIVQNVNHCLNRPALKKQVITQQFRSFLGDLYSVDL